MRSSTELVKIVDRERFRDANAQRLARLAKAKQPQAQRHLTAGSGTASTSIGLRAWTERSTPVIKAYWWVPAGFAVLVLLRTIAGG